MRSKRRMIAKKGRKRYASETELERIVERKAGGHGSRVRMGGRSRREGMKGVASEDKVVDDGPSMLT